MEGHLHDAMMNEVRRERDGLQVRYDLARNRADEASQLLAKAVIREEKLLEEGAQLTKEVEMVRNWLTVTEMREDNLKKQMEVAIRQAQREAFINQQLRGALDKLNDEVKDALEAGEEFGVSSDLTEAADEALKHTAVEAEFYILMLREVYRVSWYFLFGCFHDSQAERANLNTAVKRIEGYLGSPKEWSMLP